MKCAAGKPWVLTVIWLPFDTHRSPEHCSPSGLQWSPSRTMCPATLQKLHRIEMWNMTEFKVPTWPPNAQDLIMIARLRDVPEHVRSMEAWPCNTQDLPPMPWCQTQQDPSWGPVSMPWWVRDKCNPHWSLPELSDIKVASTWTPGGNVSKKKMALQQDDQYYSLHVSG